MENLPGTNAATTFFNQQKNNASNAKTLAADAREYHVLRWIHGSFNIAPADAVQLTVAVGGSTVFAEDITAAGPFSFNFGEFPIYSAKNEALVVTLAASGDADRISELNLAYQ